MTTLIFFLIGAIFDLMTGNSANKRDMRAIVAPLLLTESMLVLALGAYMMALGFTHDKAWMPYLSVTGFAFAGSGALLALSRGVKAGKRWATSPAILANLIALGVAKYQIEAGLYWLAIPIFALGITIIASLLIELRSSRI